MYIPFFLAILPSRTGKDALVLTQTNRSLVVYDSSYYETVSVGY